MRDNFGAKSRLGLPGLTRVASTKSAVRIFGANDSAGGLLIAGWGYTALYRAFKGVNLVKWNSLGLMGLEAGNYRRPEDGVRGDQCQCKVVTL